MKYTVRALLAVALLAGFLFCSSSPSTRPSSLAHLVSQAVDHALIEHGQASYQLNWGGPWRLVGNDGGEIDPRALVESALHSVPGALALIDFLDAYEIPVDTLRPASAPTPSSVSGPPTDAS